MGAARRRPHVRTICSTCPGAAASLSPLVQPLCIASDTLSCSERLMRRSSPVVRLASKEVMQVPAARRCRVMSFSTASSRCVGNRVTGSVPTRGTMAWHPGRPVGTPAAALLQ